MALKGNEMGWETASKGPILNARQRWWAQEHARRVKLLGEGLADEWDSVVDEFTDAQGKIHKERVLQLMECTYEMGRHRDAADKRAGCATAGRGQLEA